MIIAYILSKLKSLLKIVVPATTIISISKGTITILNALTIVLVDDLTSTDSSLEKSISN